MLYYELLLKDSSLSKQFAMWQRRAAVQGIWKERKPQQPQVRFLHQEGTKLHPCIFSFKDLSSGGKGQTETWGSTAYLYRQYWSKWTNCLTSCKAGRSTYIQVLSHPRCVQWHDSFFRINISIHFQTKEQSVLQQ